jgi:hypothetical protein
MWAAIGNATSTPSARPSGARNATLTSRPRGKVENRCLEQVLERTIGRGLQVAPAGTDDAARTSAT